MSASIEETILPELETKFNELKEYVFGAAQSQQIHEAERGIFARLLQLGLLLLMAFLKKRGDGRTDASLRGADGQELKYQGTRTVPYFSIFGKLTIERAYYWVKGAQQGVCPLDALLNLPKRCYSYLLEEWTGPLEVEKAFDKTVGVIKRILGLTLCKSSLEELVREAAEDVQPYYEQKQAPAPSAEGEIMVVTADGKGVPMKRTDAKPRKKRLSKGDKRNKKKMSTVTAVYTIDKHPRSVDDIVGDLRKPTTASPAPQSTPDKKRPRPKHKRERATLKGKLPALKEARRHVRERDPEGKLELVGLTDGDRSLQSRMKYVFPGILLILDLLHVLEYLWKAAHVFHKEGSVEAEQWVTERLRMLLTGKLSELLRELKQSVSHMKLSKSKRKTLKGVIRYYSRNRTRMQYDKYLAMGLPIGSGVIEGACRNLVKDRMELTGMRWVPEGADAMLELRAVEINGDWDDYMRFRTNREHDRQYTASALAA